LNMYNKRKLVIISTLAIILTLTSVVIAQSLMKVVETRNFSLTISPSLVGNNVYYAPISSGISSIAPFNSAPSSGLTACSNVNSTTWTCSSPSSTVYTGQNFTFGFVFSVYQIGHSVSVVTSSTYAGWSIISNMATVNPTNGDRTSAYTSTGAVTSGDTYLVLVTLAVNAGTTTPSTQTFNLGIYSS
jgi:hypothetical protein